MKADAGAGQAGFDDRSSGLGLLAHDAAGAFAGSEVDSNVEPDQLTGSASRENNVNVSNLIDESGTARAE